MMHKIGRIKRKQEVERVFFGPKRATTHSKKRSTKTKSGNYRKNDEISIFLIDQPLNNTKEHLRHKTC